MDTNISFDDEYFAHLLAARPHPWVAGMLDLSRQIVGPLEPGSSVLDAGCGTGAQFEWLLGERDVAVTGIDVAAAAIRFCHANHPGLGLTRASIGQIPFRDQTFNLVCSADVLQHLPTVVAGAAVREVARVLKPGGRFFVRTNAACGRSDVHEDEDWHLYRPTRLAGELEAAGLVVERLTFANTLPAAVATMRNRLGRLRPSSRQSGHREVDPQPRHGIGIPEPVSGARAFALSLSLGAERRYLSRPDRTLPWGHTLLALARRP